MLTFMMLKDYERENDKISLSEIYDLLDLLNVKLYHYQKLYIKLLLKELRIIENE